MRFEEVAEFRNFAPKDIYVSFNQNVALFDFDPIDHSDYLEENAHSKFKIKCGLCEWRVIDLFGEEETSLGLDMLEMDFRQYDPSLGRFFTIDAMAESQMRLSPYHFTGGNPVMFADPTGLKPQNPAYSAPRIFNGYGTDGGGAWDVLMGGGNPRVNFGTSIYTPRGGGGSFADYAEPIENFPIWAQILWHDKEKTNFSGEYVMSLINTLEKLQIIGKAFGAGEELKDMTEQFNATLWETQSFFTQERLSLERMTLFPVAKRITKLVFFAALVKTNAPYDLKNQGYSAKEIGYWSIYDGRTMRFDDYGNYNYGVAARSYGLSLFDAIQAAGLNQISKFDAHWNPAGFFDDPRDTSMIVAGYNATIISPPVD